MSVSTCLAVFALCTSGDTGGQVSGFTEQIPESTVSFDMIRVPDGDVTIEGKKFAVKNLLVSKTEITWDVYDIYALSRDLSDSDRAQGVDAKSRPSRPYGMYDRGFGHNGYPAIGITHNAATMFCEWLSKKTGKKYRLLEEHEWVYAASAGQGEPGDLEEVAWYWDNADDTTHPVGKKKPNPWGLYDVLGNASEWVNGYDKQPVTRGGSFNDKKPLVNLTARVPYSPLWQERDSQIPKSRWWLSDGPHVGFRIALVQ